MAAGMTWHSQAGQDEWVIEQHGDGPGYFVDVGAHDGIVHSNTYVLERYYRWRGLCIEANPYICPSLNLNRQCEWIWGAATDRDAFIKRAGDRIDPNGGETVQGQRLVSMLAASDAPPVIDYLSIDVEGHELEVLAGMDFDRWKVRLITIEHNRYSDGTARKDAIYAHLTAAGFERVVEDVVAPGYGEYEDWYVHR